MPDPPKIPPGQWFVPPEQWFGVHLVQKAPAAGPSGETEHKFLTATAKTVAGATAVITALVAALGTLEGGLNRLLVNEPAWAIGAFIAMLVGVALAFIATSDIDPLEVRIALVVVGSVSFLAGFAVLAWKEGESLGANERPAVSAIAATTADGSSLEGKVSAGGLESDQWVYIEVRGVQADVDEPKTLYQTRAGPDRNGKVDASFTISGVLGRFQFVRIGATLADSPEDEGVDPCFHRPPRIDQSCATVYPTRTRERPVLTASWEEAFDRANVLSVEVKSSVIDPDDVVLLDVSDARGGRLFYRTMFSPSSAGGVEASAKVAVPFTARRVCIVGLTISAADESALASQPSSRTCQVDSFDLTRTSFAIATAPQKP